MSGEGEHFVGLRKLTKKIDSELFGFLENHPQHQQEQQQQPEQQDCFHEDKLASGFNAAPIITKLKTSYYIKGENDPCGDDDCFVEVPSRSQQTPSFKPVLSNRAFGLPIEKLNIDKFRAEMLEAHNNYRDRHGISRLKLSDVLNQQAQKWADYLAEYNFLDHNDDHDYGENIYTCNSSDPNSYPTAQQVCNSWYSEIKNYVFGRDPTGSAVVTHFTQIIWRTSTDLGVGIAKAKDGAVYVVANYNPPGNVDDKFAGNVFPTSAAVPRLYQAMRPRSLPNDLYEPGDHSEKSQKFQEPLTIRGTPYEAPSKLAFVEQQLQIDVSPLSAKRKKFIKLVLIRHNVYRKKHDVPFLKISQDLNRSAQEWAEQCAAQGEILAHDDVTSFGECITNVSSYEADFYPDAEEICRDFYNEVSNYRYTVDPGNDNVYDFTQMVWKSTTEMGVGIAKSENEDYYIVFHYNPPGNVVGQFSFNVFRPKTMFAPQNYQPNRPRW